MEGSDQENHKSWRRAILKQLQKQELNELTELIPKNVALYYTNLIDKLEVAQNNKPDENISDENDQIMDYTC